MANNYTEILTLANKNNMGLSNTIKRDYGIPLDYSSVQETYEAALNYAKTSTLAYIGQPISVGDTLYVVTDEAGGYLKAVGTKPTGDNKSVFVGDDGKVAMFGFEAAADQTLPQKKPNGTIEWVPIDAIVDGDGNTKTEVKTAADSAITVTPTYNSENDTYTYTLDVTFPAIPEYSIIKETATDKITYKLTKNGTQIGEVVEVSTVYDDSAITEDISNLDSRVTAVEDIAADQATRLEGIELFFKDAAKDDNSGENLQNALDTLVEIQEYISNDGQAASDMLDAIESNTNAIEVLNGTGENSVGSQIAAAISIKAAEDASKYATQDEVNVVRNTANSAAKKTEVDTALEEKVDKTTLNTTLTSYYTKDETFSQDEITNLLADITGGSDSVESLTSLKERLDDHFIENNSSFEAVDNTISQLNSTLNQAALTIEKNKNDITAINNADTGILAQAKVEINNQIQTLVEGQLNTNTEALADASGRIANVESNVTNLTDKVALLETDGSQFETQINSLDEEYTNLSQIVTEHTADIQNIRQANIDTASALSLYKTENDITVKKNSDDIKTVNELFGDIPEGKTVSEMISDAQLAATYDDTLINQKLITVENSITTLNSEGEGSIKKSVDNALNDFATKISNDGVVNTYKELVDYAAANGDEMATLIGNLDALKAIVGETDNEGNSTGLIKEFSSLSNKVGIKDVSTQITEAINGLNIEDYAKNAELTRVINQHDIDKSNLESELLKKANDSDLASISKTGSTDDLVPGNLILILDCGGSSLDL